MDLIQELVKKIWFLIPIIIGLLIIYWIMSITFSLLGISPKDYLKKDILPSPTLYQLKPAPVPSGDATNPTTGESYTVYQNSGNLYLPMAVNGNIRNLHLSDNSNVLSSGVTIYGEANSKFFTNGRFLVTVEDDGKNISTTYGFAGQDPSKYSWVPFQAKLGFIPPNTRACVLNFKNLNDTNTIAIPIACK